MDNLHAGGEEVDMLQVGVVGPEEGLVATESVCDLSSSSDTSR